MHPGSTETFIELQLQSRTLPILRVLIRKTTSMLTMFVTVLITSCHCALQRKN